MAQARVIRRGAAPEAETGTARPQMRRTVRTAVAQAKPEVDVKAEVTARLQLIAQNNAAIDAAAASNDTLYAEIEKILRDNNSPGITDGHLQAEIVPVYSRVSRDIDVAQLMKRLKLPEFLACVSVSVTEAKKFLSEKEIDAISTKSGGEKTGEKLSIKEVKTETKRKAK